MYLREVVNLLYRPIVAGLAPITRRQSSASSQPRPARYWNPHCAVPAHHLVTHVRATGSPAADAGSSTGPVMSHSSQSSG